MGFSDVCSWNLFKLLLSTQKGGKKEKKNLLMRILFFSLFGELQDSDRPTVDYSRLLIMVIHQIQFVVFSLLFASYLPF